MAGLFSLSHYKGLKSELYISYNPLSLLLFVSVCIELNYVQVIENKKKKHHLLKTF